MGRITAAEIAVLSDISIINGIEYEGHPEIGNFVEGIPVIADCAGIPDADVWLDFSLAGPAVKHVRKAASLGKPFVLAATGYSIAEEEELLWHSKLCPLLVAPNLSAGIGALENICLQAARLLPQSFETGIVEIHHSSKKDAPSGTAKRIAERMSRYGQKPQILSMRAGGAIGEHQIRFVGKDEELIITHRAWSRRAFSSGVARALRFIVGKQAGYYTLQDIYTTD